MEPMRIQTLYTLSWSTALEVSRGGPKPSRSAASHPLTLRSLGRLSAAASGQPCILRILYFKLCYIRSNFWTPLLPGELFARITRVHSFSEHDASVLIKAMLECLAFCHEMGVIHRDLSESHYPQSHYRPSLFFKIRPHHSKRYSQKRPCNRSEYPGTSPHPSSADQPAEPENFLMQSADESVLGIKGNDFGLSVFFKPGDAFQEIVGSLYYIAPEVIKSTHAEKADIWSVGVITYIMLVGERREGGKGRGRVSLNKIFLWHS